MRDNDGAARRMCHIVHLFIFHLSSLIVSMLLVLIWGIKKARGRTGVRLRALWIRRRPPQSVVPGVALLDTVQRWEEVSIGLGTKATKKFCVGKDWVVKWLVYKCLCFRFLQNER